MSSRRRGRRSIGRRTRELLVLPRGRGACWSCGGGRPGARARFADIDDQEELASALDAEAEELLVEASDLTTGWRARTCRRRGHEARGEAEGRPRRGRRRPELGRKGLGVPRRLCGTDLVQRVLREIGGLEPFTTRRRSGSGRRRRSARRSSCPRSGATRCSGCAARTHRRKATRIQEL